MKRAAVFLVILFGILFLLAVFIARNLAKEQNKSAQKLTPFTVVLDWTPNTNHTGMYVALAKGWYKEQGLDVKILPYASGTAPEVLVTSGKADVAVSSTEGVIAAAASGNPVVSIAAIIQHNTSGFIARSDAGIKSPKDLDNKIDGDSASPTEKAILQKIITSEGGKGTFKNVNLDVDSMQALAAKKIDFFWAFEGWEVIQAKQQGIPVVYFSSLKYGIPDYYTPVLVSSPTEIKQKPELLKKFMTATKKGKAYKAAYMDQEPSTIEARIQCATLIRKALLDKKKSKKEDSPTDRSVGAAMRRKVNREQEVYSAMINNKDAMGIDPKFHLYNLEAWFTQEQLERESHKYDNETYKV